MNPRDGLRYIKRWIIYLIITAGICVSLLIVTSCIPAYVIEKSVRDSSTYFLKEELFQQLKPGHKTTTCDNYADCILLNIIHELDTSNPFIAVMKAEYAYEETENVNITLKRAVLSREENCITKVNYSRYWHGSMVLLRPLLVFGDIQMVRRILAVITAILFFCNLAVLYKKYSKSAAFYYLLAFGIIQGYVMFYCVNYIMNFLIVNAMLLPVEKKLVETEEGWCCLMTAGGVVTSFCDFLTTETMTLTLPLIICLVIRKRAECRGSLPYMSPMKTTVFAILHWGSGYSFMFLLKWLFVYLLLGKGALIDSLQQATMRIQDGNMFFALSNNIAAMFHLREYEFNRYGVVLAIMFAVFAAGIFVFTVGQKDPYLNAMILTSLIPYFRYAVIKNHSQIHYFFTYRAQITTLIVLFLCIENIWIKISNRRKQDFKVL